MRTPTSYDMETPAEGGVVLGEHVLVRREQYDALVRFERRAHEKLAQLRSVVDGAATAEQQSYIDCLAWLCGEMP